MANRIQLRRGTAAEWAAANPVLAQGEPGVETDTGKQKFGNGVGTWTALPYASVGPTGATGPANTDASLLASGTVPEGRLPTRLSVGDLSATFDRAFEASSSIVYDGVTGNVTSTTEGGITTTYTYNGDGTVNTETRLGKVRTWTYDGSGNPTSSTVV